VDLQGHGKLFGEFQGTSLINPYSLTAVTRNVQSLLKSDFAASSIMVIIYYSAQVKSASIWPRPWINLDLHPSLITFSLSNMSMLLKKAGFPIQVRSIDGSQGKEAPIVIGDTADSRWSIQTWLCRG